MSYAKCIKCGASSADKARIATLETALAAMTVERDTLRDEVRAWRAFEEEAEERSWSKAWPVHSDLIADAQDKTDAAGIKEVER